jgi:hypothetical protein
MTVDHVGVSLAVASDAERVDVTTPRSLGATRVLVLVSLRFGLADRREPQRSFASSTTCTRQAAAPPPPEYG